MRDKSNAHTILLLTTPFRPNIGGVETHLDDLIEVGVENGWKFEVLTYQPLVTKVYGRTIEKGKGYRVIRIPWIRLNLFLKLEKYPVLEFLYLFPILFVFGFLFLIFNNSKINVIHAQGLVAGAAGVLLGKVFQKKVIISTHSIYNFPKKGLYPFFVRLLLNNCNYILTLSNQSKQEMLSLRISEEKVSVFTYWINQEIFKPVDEVRARKILKLKNGFICLFIGRLVSGKGLEELLETAKNTKDIFFLIVGDGPLESKVTNFLSLPNIKYAGKVDNKKLPIYYSAADILIVPSTHEEGYGRVILEALSCGLPIVASNRGGIKEAINSSIGKLITISPVNIKNTLEYFLKNKSRLKILASNARKYAQEHFNKKNVQMILKHYE